MKNDLILGFRLMRYGVSVTMNMVLMIAMLVMGLLFEAMEVLVGWDQYINLTQIDLGAVFLLCAVMFSEQLVLSVDVGALAQASPCKKKLQTTIPSLMAGIGSLVSLTIVVVFRLIATALGAQGLRGILFVGAFDAVLIVYFAFIYKFFVPALVVLYVFMFGWGFFAGLLEGLGIALSGLTSFSLHPAVEVLLAYALVILATVFHYLLARALYKRPFSKGAFGAAMRRSL